MLIRMRVHAGPAFLQSRGHLVSGDDGRAVTFSGMKRASSVVNIFHLVGALVLQKSAKVLFCVSLEGSQDPAPRLHCCFLTALPWSLHPLPSLISNCLNLHFGTQGRGHRKAFVPRSPTGSCSVSDRTLFKALMHLLHLYILMSLQ